MQYSLPLALIPEGPAFDPGRYLALVAALIVAVIAIGLGFRRVVGGALKHRASKRSLRILEVLPLGGKRQLAVVRVYDRTFALGLGDKDVTLVAELDPVEADGQATETTDPDGYASLIAQAKQRIRGQAMPAASSVQELIG